MNKKDRLPKSILMLVSTFIVVFLVVVVLTDIEAFNSLGLGVSLVGFSLVLSTVASITSTVSFWFLYPMVRS